ncbi:MAG: hypothetical protein P4L85_01710 [Paludisphaera borealis]|uniref:hypothetical protein n=1 Tax=Paludisphaera borealis TaxID=1387353 RepID=UPI00284AF9C8|nr:hypothetical protein [Paludisphaera borealis]MDR3618036.1 hypothetical protein [Paludisphaera borealis]
MAKRPLRVVQHLFSALVAWVLVCGGPARGQTVDVGAEPAESDGKLSTADEARLQLLSDPDAVKKGTGKDRSRPPFEIYRSQIAPNDVIPWLKPNQWCSLSLDLQANDDDYEGSLQSLPVPLVGMPHEMIYAREARLVKAQRSRLGMPILLPRIPKEKELLVELVRPNAIRADQLYSVPLYPLPAHQMLVMVLTKESNAAYAAWSKYSAMIPATFDRGDGRILDQMRYYRLLLPLEPDKPLLPSHPLTWTAISHIFWEGMEPDVLSASQQTALLDWLHWGGQLIVIGGAGPTYSIFRESFLEPYLPADPTGESRLLVEADLKPLSDSYPPPFRLPTGEEPTRPARSITPEIYERFGLGYTAPEPIKPAAGRPLYVAGLRPREGAVTIPLGEGSPDLLAVESRVGRGRITMLTVNPTDPALVAWGGMDTLVRRVVFRRPEEMMVPMAKSGESFDPQYQDLAMGGPDLSWYRIAARDVGPRVYRAPSENRGLPRRGSPPVGAALARPSASMSVDFATTDGNEGPNLPGVAEWVDSTHVPLICRTLLERASGITVPSSQFVLKVLLAYVLAVAPLNWLLCRYVLRRREVAWIIVPLLAFGFAVGVERIAAYDMGYDSACDELDLLEIQGTFPRGHLSRFASIYTTGRGQYTIKFPNNPTALALPLDIGRSIAGEDLTTSVWRSYPVPALEEFTVQPRSLSMFRSEEMVSLPGSITVEADGPRRVLRNDGGLELRDAKLVDFSDPAEPLETYLGTIAAGATVDLDPAAAPPAPDHIAGFDGPDPTELLAKFLEYVEKRPEAVGELRLVAWSPGPAPGPSFEPVLDRHRGATVVVVHLRYSPPPSPASRHYNSMAPKTAEAAGSSPIPAKAAARRGREEMGAS